METFCNKIPPKKRQRSDLRCKFSKIHTNSRLRSSLNPRAISACFIFTLLCIWAPEWSLVISFHILWCALLAAKFCFTFDLQQAHTNSQQQFTELVNFPWKCRHFWGNTIFTARITEYFYNQNKPNPPNQPKPNQAFLFPVRAVSQFLPSFHLPADPLTLLLP